VAGRDSSFSHISSVHARPLLPDFGPLVCEKGKEASTPQSDSITRYPIECRKCTFQARATSLWAPGEQLNLHASRCEVEPAVLYELPPNETTRNSKMSA
jgi:hypothetical protein